MADDGQQADYLRQSALAHLGLVARAESAHAQPERGEAGVAMGERPPLSLVDLQQMRSWNGAPHTNWTIYFSPDLSTYALVDRDHKLVRVRSAEESDHDQAAIPYSSQYALVQFSTDNRHLIVYEHFPARVSIWNLKTRNQILSRKFAGNLVCADISSDGRFLAVGEFGESVRLFEVESGKLTATQGISSSDWWLATKIRA